MGLDTTTAGAKSGTVGILFNADTGSGNAGTLTPGSVSVTGAVYRYADGVPGADRDDRACRRRRHGCAQPQQHRPGGWVFRNARRDPERHQRRHYRDHARCRRLRCWRGRPATRSRSASRPRKRGSTRGRRRSASGRTGRGIDGLGQTAEAAVTAPVTVTVDNYAQGGVPESVRHRHADRQRQQRGNASTWERSPWEPGRRRSRSG